MSSNVVELLLSKTAVQQPDNHVSTHVSTRVSTQVSTRVSTHFISRFEIPLSDPATYIITPKETYVGGILRIVGPSSEAGWPGKEGASRKPEHVGIQKQIRFGAGRPNQGGLMGLYTRGRVARPG